MATRKETIMLTVMGVIIIWGGVLVLVTPQYWLAKIKPNAHLDRKDFTVIQVAELAIIMVAIALLLAGIEPRSMSLLTIVCFSPALLLTSRAKAKAQTY